MISKCEKCGMYFEDEYRSALCPHAALAAYLTPMNIEQCREIARMIDIDVVADAAELMGGVITNERDNRIG